jgi:hypothetical protein
VQGVDHGERISYMALEEGTPVLSGDGTELGTVKRVLADWDEDIFDGLIVSTADGDRFVDAEGIVDIYERAVVLETSGEDARQLPEATPGAPVVEVDPEDTVKRSPAEEVARRMRLAWQRIAKKY